MIQQTNSDVHSINSDNVEVKMYTFAAETNIFTFLNAGVNIFINSYLNNCKLFFFSRDDTGTFPLV